MDNMETLFVIEFDQLKEESINCFNKLIDTFIQRVQSQVYDYDKHNNLFDDVDSEVDTHHGISTALPSSTALLSALPSALPSSLPSSRPSNLREDDEEDIKGGQTSDDNEDHLMNLDDIGPMPTPSDFVIDMPIDNIVPGNCDLRESKRFILMDWEASTTIQHPTDATLKSYCLNKFHPIQMHFF